MADVEHWIQFLTGITRPAPVDDDEGQPDSPPFSNTPEVGEATVTGRALTQLITPASRDWHGWGRRRFNRDPFVCKFILFPKVPGLTVQPAERPSIRCVESSHRSCNSNYSISRAPALGQMAKRNPRYPYGTSDLLKADSWFVVPRKKYCLQNFLS